jgi:predicted metal-dependent phosphoesterase TrpH
VIDLHTHTTASDGLCSPADLVRRAREAGITVLSVTDHDTVAGCGEAAAACRDTHVEFVPGIEITAVAEGADVHVLGYFIDPGAEGLQAFIAVQRRRRIDRIRTMIERLAALGLPLDGDAVLQPALDDPSHAIGRPAIARALVDAGFVDDTNAAFDTWLARGRPAFVSREGAAPAEVFSRIHDAGGIASLAHPGLLARDEWIPAFVGAGLDAIEAYHSKHDAAATARYVALAGRLGVAISGGSDYHADGSHGAGGLGSVSLPAELFDTLTASCSTRSRLGVAPPTARPPRDS